ncbi:hypothetical protein [Xylanivirga thermophila]|uniref:hypothetical protein n=1 Tax=Xylanivirga thermophila TaxID=2496273 RepID=UPI00101C4755|nr:hypothetical protein [Xylanivirga thermophila]
MQKKHRISYILICLIIIISLVGCSEKIEPFSHSPENDIKIDYMEDIIQNQDKYKEMYMDYSSMRIVGTMSKELEQFITDLEKESIETVGKFADNGDKFIVFQISLDDSKGVIEEGAKALIDNYLKYTRLDDEKATEFGLSSELEAQDPIGKVKKYMGDKNIKITEIVLPQAFEKVDYDLYPVKCTYRYVLKGTVGKKPFEKEVVQDFYIGIDWSKGKEKENMRDTIEYIRDISQN